MIINPSAWSVKNKKEEGKRPDYAEVSKQMIGQCLAEMIRGATAFTTFTPSRARSEVSSLLYRDLV